MRQNQGKILMLSLSKSIAWRPFDYYLIISPNVVIFLTLKLLHLAIRFELLICKSLSVNFQWTIKLFCRLCHHGYLDGADYRIIKNDCDLQISILEGKLVEQSKSDNGLGPLLNKALKNISRLVELYQTADPQRKRHIISSMYPENLTFDGTQRRTIRITETIRVFGTVKAVLDGKKEGKPSKNSICLLLNFYSTSPMW